MYQSGANDHGVMDLTVKMEFSANVPADTQAYTLVVSDRMLKFKSKMSVLFLERAIEMEHMMQGEVVVVRTMAKDSSTIVVSGGSTSIQTVFTPPLYLKNGLLVIYLSKLFAIHVKSACLSSIRFVCFSSVLTKFELFRFSRKHCCSRGKKRNGECNIQKKL